MKSLQLSLSKIHQFLNKDTPNLIFITHIFLRSLAAVYCIAFLSLWVQLEGLIGTEGILPVDKFLDHLYQKYDAGFWETPTLLWLNASNSMINGLALAGGLIALLGICLPFSTILWFVLWFLCLSLFYGGQTFLSFQWDIFLLEIGFLTMFLMPFSLLPRTSQKRPPNGLTVFLFHWLLFRFMFASGVVKLASMDAVWWNLTALNYHYFTQPLPPWTAWYAHQLPELLQKISTGGMFFVELIMPFFLFSRGGLRTFTGIGFVLLQVGIILTGNYGFFNLLTIVLCLWLFQDSTIYRIPIPEQLTSLREKLTAYKQAFPEVKKAATLSALKISGRITAYLSAALIVLFGVMLLTNASLRLNFPWPDFLWKTFQAQSTYHIVNSYGLFADMTEERLEIIIEGSNDGQQWQAYQFKYKPGNLGDAPSFVAPHQPRLDWQMWFAALGNWRQNIWFVNLAVRLLQGSEPVIQLLASNPFPEQPPRFIRARSVDYQFTSFSEREKTGNWWKEGREKEYLPVISRDDLPYLLKQLRLN